MNGREAEEITSKQQASPNFLFVYLFVVCHDKGAAQRSEPQYYPVWALEATVYSALALVIEQREIAVPRCSRAFSFL